MSAETPSRLALMRRPPSGRPPVLSTELPGAWRAPEPYRVEQIALFLPGHRQPWRPATVLFYMLDWKDKAGG